MTDRFLLHSPTGQVLIWQGHLAADPAFVEVADAKGTPLNIIEGEATVVEEKKTRKPRVAAIVKELEGDEALGVDASRGLAAKGM